MKVNGQDMNLQQYVEYKKLEYADKPSWMWEDEGLVWAVQDYECSVPYVDWSDEEKKYLEEVNLMELVDLFITEDVVEEEDNEEDMDEHDLYAKVFCECDIETVIDNALGFIPEDQHRLFLLACLGHDID